MHAANQASHCYEGEDILAKKAMNFPSANQKYRVSPTEVISCFIFILLEAWFVLKPNMDFHFPHLQLQLNSSDCFFSPSQSVKSQKEKRKDTSTCSLKVWIFQSLLDPFWTFVNLCFGLGWISPSNPNYPLFVAAFSALHNQPFWTINRLSREDHGAATNTKGHHLAQLRGC